MEPKSIRIEREAEDDIATAMAWYDDQRSGLGTEFFAEVRSAVRSLATPGPECRPIQGIAADLDVRRRLVKRFPYVTVLIALPTVVRVIAVAHVRRQPGFWRARL